MSKLTDLAHGLVSAKVATVDTVMASSDESSLLRWRNDHTAEPHTVPFWDLRAVKEDPAFFYETSCLLP